MLRTLSIIFLSVRCIACTGQTVADTAFNPLKPTINNSSFNLRVSTGIQRSFYVDVGASWERFAGSGHGYTDVVVFTAFNIFPSLEKEVPHVYGLKAGAEFGGSFFLLGLDLGHYWNRQHTDFLITPKYGIGFGLVNFVYGYGFSATGKNIGRIGKHTFGLQSNIPFFRKDRMKNDKSYKRTF